MTTDSIRSTDQRPSFVWRARAMLHKYRIIVYIALVLASQLFQRNSNRMWLLEPAQTDTKLSPEQTYLGTSTTTIPAMGKEGPVGDATIELNAIEWATGNPIDRPPIILLHGSPGDASNFSQLGPVLAERGDVVFSVDLPGFGNSTAKVPSYSIRAAAHSVLALMEALDIDRAHLVGWSNSGGVILNMADIAPDRVATITLLAATGAQHTEGSGDYYFEHAKYALGYGIVVLLPEIMPHFGVFGDFNFRRAFIRSFWDTDQRPLAAIMGRMTTPTLILQGRHDPLVADWAAEEHHRLMPTSQLIMLDASHFLPFAQPDLTAGYLGEFFRRHDQPGVEPLTNTRILEPKRPGMYGWIGSRLARVPRDLPWWISAIGIAVLALLLPRTAIALAGLAAGLTHLDLGVALVGLVAGRAIRRKPGRSLKVWLKLIFGTFVLILFAASLAPLLTRAGFEAIGTSGALLAIALVVLAIRILPAVRLPFTWKGRCLLKASFVRAPHREFWPTWAIYLPIIPHLVRLSIRHRGMLLFTACNPAIDNGGGMVGESKYDIMDGLKHAGKLALHTELIEPASNPKTRADHAIDRIRSEARLGGYPVILKPNAGQHGKGVSVARNDQDVHAYFNSTNAPIVIQRFDPGPNECGILWCRSPGNTDDPLHENKGTILSITRKEFAEIQGDGKRTIERLVYTNPRFATSAENLLASLNDDRKRVPSSGESIVIGVVGNHVCGTIFRDGADLITPELQSTIDQISQTFPHPHGGGLDVGRYDIRYESDDQLRKGEAFGIVELNGVTGESTNLYDPDKSLAWAIGVMKTHWTRMYELGAQRRAHGHKPLTLAQLVRILLTS